ncbi:MAG: epimerase, partial [Candidatus Kapaibacteriota bacterium]
MKLIIAGATGGIGSRLAFFCHQRGDSIYTITRNPSKAQNLFPFAVQNFSWEDNWDSVLPEIDAIFNLSG